MKLHSFQELTTRIVNLSTRNNTKVSITFSGDTAYTNPKTVNIPALPAGTILSLNQFSIWLGYVLHEGPGHQTHTDLELYSEACKKKSNPQFSYILNLLEDIRIENADISLYPGDRKYLDSVHQFCDDKIPSDLCQNPGILGKIYKELYTKYRNLDTHRIQGKLEDRELTSILDKIRFCSSTQDCIALAETVVEYLKQKQEEKQEEKSQEKQQENNPNSDNPQDQKNQDKEGEDKDNQDQDKEEENNSDKQDNQDNSREESLDSSSPNTSSEPQASGSNPKTENKKTQIEEETKSEEESNSFYFSSNSQALIWQELTEIKNLLEDLKSQNKTEEKKDTPPPDLKNKSIFPSEDISRDKIYIPSEENLPRFLSTRSKLSSQILALKKMFRIYLQTRSKKAQIRGLEEGKLDPYRLHLAKSSNLIFKDSTSKPFLDTSIELMIDLSGSMREDITRASAIILAEALSSISQIKLSISGFTTNNSKNRNYSYARDIPPNTGRIVGMDIIQFKNFQEPYHKCKAKLGAITTRGNTPLGDAYGKALEHILPQSTPRKIIFLITDGKPEFLCGNNHSDFLLMKRVKTTAKKLGIETIALGVGNSVTFLDDYFDQVAYIKEISVLPQKLMEVLKKALTP